MSFYGNSGHPDHVGYYTYSSVHKQSIIAILLRTFSFQLLFVQTSHCGCEISLFCFCLFVFRKYMCCEEVTAFIFLLFFCWILLILTFPRVDRRKKTITDVFQAQILSKCLVGQMHKYATLSGDICRFLLQEHAVPFCRVISKDRLCF